MERLNPQSLDLADPAAIIDEFERVDRNVAAVEAATGVVEWYTGDAMGVPDGYVLCDGRAIARKENRRLFAIMGTRYGAGDEATTFNVPNLMGKVPVGVSVGEFAGQELHLDVRDGPEYDVDLFRLVPILRKG